MTAYWTETAWKVFAIDDLNIDGSGDTHVWYPEGPVALKRVAFIVTTEVTTGNGDSQITVGIGDISASPTTIGTWTLSSGTIPVNSVAYVDLGLPPASSTGVDGSTVYTAQGMPVCYMGQKVTFTNGTSTHLADAGAGILAVEYVQLPFAGTEQLAYAVEGTIA